MKKVFTMILSGIMVFSITIGNAVSYTHLDVYKRQDQGFKCGIDTVIVGPCNDREGAVKLGNNQSLTQEEADAFEKIAKAGYKIKFALLPDVSIGKWDDFKGKFGY